MIISTLLKVTGLVVLAGAAHAAEPAWSRQVHNGDPVAMVRWGSAVAYVTCSMERGPRYRLLVVAPAGTLSAATGVKGAIQGARKVALRFDRVAVDDKGNARLTASGGTRGTTGDQSGALRAIEAMRTARDVIHVESGGFRTSLPSSGIADAMAPLVARCGDIATLAERAANREVGNPQ